MSSCASLLPARMDALAPPALQDKDLQLCQACPWPPLPNAGQCRRWHAPSFAQAPLTPWQVLAAPPAAGNAESCSRTMLGAVGTAGWQAAGKTITRFKTDPLDHIWSVRHGSKSHRWLGRAVPALGQVEMPSDVLILHEEEKRLPNMFGFCM